jgi:phospholipid transport system transporter-binding protein
MTLSGRVIEPEVVALRREGEEWLAALGDGPCEVDLTTMETASSVLLSLLLCWQRQARAVNLRIHFAGANERLRALAIMSRVADQLPGFEI